MRELLIMKQTTRTLSIYSSDTAGTASMLYELGGMTVIHDASGCNSTYSTHDEPRWYQMDSMIYISGLTETDVILGNDERLIEDVCKAAKELSPRFITLAVSPMPVMTGTDLDAIADEIRERTLLPVFPIHTNGMNSYLKGASDSLLAFLQYFCKENVEKTVRPSVNIIGATPLDFSINGTVESIRKFLMEEGFDVISCMSMGSSFEEIISAGKAQVNLVISSCGLAAAKYLFRQFHTPFVTGVPLGKRYAGHLAQELRKAIKNGENSFSCLYDRSIPQEKENAPAVIHESIFASSLACALEKDLSIPANVIVPEELQISLYRKDADIVAECEDSLREILTHTGTLIADPFYQVLISENQSFIPLPHEAFSGRCFRRANKVLAARDLSQWRDILC